MNRKRVRGWKATIDEHLQRKEEEAEEEIKKEEREARRTYLTKLASHKQMFRCHISGCQETSQGPEERNTNPMSDNESSIRYYDWDEPTGLEKCDVCREWVCHKHLHKGVCKRCAEKGRFQ